MGMMHEDAVAAPAFSPQSQQRGPIAPRAKRRRTRWGEIWRWTVTLIWFTVAAGILSGLILVAAIYRQARAEQAQPADAIVVLGTAQFNGWPGPVFQARLDHALELWRQGYAPLVVVTGGKMAGDEFTEAEAAVAYLTQAGVPLDAIVTDNEARDTWESMQNVALLLEPHGLHNVILVSDGFHLFRAKIMARDVGLEGWGSPVVESPIVPGGGSEFSYVLREAAAITAHLWQTRLAPVFGVTFLDRAYE
jgi:uncharacterized SAM-binding protein YcdF (DUF218 family)